MKWSGFKLQLRELCRPFAIDGFAAGGEVESAQRARDVYSADKIKFPDDWILSENPLPLGRFPTPVSWFCGLLALEPWSSKSCFS